MTASCDATKALIAASFRELSPSAFQAGREFERAAIAKSLRSRGAEALAQAKRGLLTEGEAVRLSRWLHVAADEVEADLEEGNQGHD